MPKQKENKTETKTVNIEEKKADNAEVKTTRGNKCQYATKVQPYLQDISRYIRCGVTEGQICRYYGVGKTQWAEYKKKYPELSETLLKAKDDFKTDLINKSYQVAMGYDYTEESIVEYKDKDGNVTGTKKTTHKRHSKADGGMIQFLLINRFSDEFAKDPQAIELRKKALELAKQGVISADNLGSV